MADYNEAIRIDSKYALAYNNRGNVYSSKDYNEAIQIDPRFAVAYRNRGILYLNKGATTTPSPTATRRFGSTPNTQWPMTTAPTHREPKAISIGPSLTIATPFGSIPPTQPTIQIVASPIARRAPTTAQ